MDYFDFQLTTHMVTQSKFLSMYSTFILQKIPVKNQIESYLFEIDLTTLPLSNIKTIKNLSLLTFKKTSKNYKNQSQN